MRKKVTGCIILACLLGCTGCVSPRTMQAYLGDPKPESEVAVLLVQNPILLNAVDGRPVELGGHNVDDRVYLLPGVHTIKVDNLTKDQYYSGSLGQLMAAFNAPKDLSFDAKPGRSYRVKLSNITIGVRVNNIDMGKGWSADIEDAATGERCTVPSAKSPAQHQ